MNQTAIIHPFGSAPKVVPAGYKLATEVVGRDDMIAKVFGGADVVLVRGAAVAGEEGAHQVGVFVPGDAHEEEGMQTWLVDGSQVAAVVCSKLIAGGARFTCEPAPDSQWFAFTMQAADSTRLRPPIAQDTAWHSVGRH